MDLVPAGDDDVKRPCLVNSQTVMMRTPTQVDQTVVCMDKGTVLGKKDTTLSHHHTFTRKIIPPTDKRLDEGNMTRLKPKMQKVGGPIINVILGVDGMLSL